MRIAVTCAAAALMRMCIRGDNESNEDIWLCGLLFGPQQPLVKTWRLTWLQLCTLSLPRLSRNRDKLIISFPMRNCRPAACGKSSGVRTHWMMRLRARLVARYQSILLSQVFLENFDHAVAARSYVLGSTKNASNKNRQNSTIGFFVQIWNTFLNNCGFLNYK